MSTYQWAEAQLIFNTVEELQTAVQSLRDGGWLTDSNQILSGEDDNNLAGNGMVCIIGTTFILPSEQYLNIGRVIYDVIKEANNGYFHSNCDDGDLWIECWKDGKWVSANSYEDIALYVETDREKDFFLLDEDEFIAKNTGDYDYYEERSSVFELASQNLINQNR